MRLVLERQSERFVATGNLAGEGALNPLGRPALDALSIMLREAVQNSWDARTGKSIRIAIDGLSVAAPNLAAHMLFGDSLKGASADAMPTMRAVDRDGVTSILAISDRGTHGLGGPTRADVMTDPSERRDFVDFLRNVGEPPDRRFSTGGTYGYGKAALYLASQVRAIVAYSRWRAPTGHETRLMASAIGPRFEIAGGPDAGRYTGRHWFGVRDGELVEPLVGEVADKAASELGLAGFEDGETGTTIAILNPDFDGPFDKSAISFLVEAALWWFWPKMLAHPDGEPAIAFSFSWNGKQVPLPSPREFPPLDLYCAAYDAAKALRSNDADGLTKVRPILLYQERVGIAALRVGPTRPRGRIPGQRARYPRPVSGPPDFSSPSHHFALMRVPELVVKYSPAPELAGDTVEYGGVFLAEPSLDRTFADAEPPAHDDWIAEESQSRDRSRIRAAFRGTRELATTIEGANSAGHSDALTPLGEFARALGGLLFGQDGDGPSPREIPERGRGTRRRGARIRIAGPYSLQTVDGVAAATVPFEVLHAPGSYGTLVTGEGGVVLEDGTVERDGPASGVHPEILGYVDPSGKFWPGKAIRVPAGIDGLWSVLITVDAGFVSGLSLDASPVDATGST